ncbi:hypothetical protein Q5Y75_15100 [Ruegeria sp. 2205SS24-7]|uniref:hypothetical protein n=1 Tax=Ruegeria discodermiae TaxID=3064389 RepID=UPI0027415A3B|nr:hypothetical protein [Ruegeria sp. 2205SS24-7]MDP5218554.1 hypothetical protein [Ruegeria sp. 2205SS24-7]
MRFTDLFLSFGSAWPREFINTEWPPDSSGDIAGILAEIDNAVRIHDAATDIGADGTVSLVGEMKLVTVPARTEFVSGIFPSIRFAFAGEIDWSSKFHFAIQPTGAFTLHIDELPLEVLLPADLLAAHPDEDLRETDKDITLTESADRSVIKRDFRLLIEPEGTLRLEAHLPISIGPCRLMGIPMKAVHDLTFIASPGRAFNVHDWIVRPMDAGDFPPIAGGGLGFGGIEVDWEAENSPMASLGEALHIDPNAELVLEDVVLPALFLPPIPRHGTIGLRRVIDPGESLEDHLTFEGAPINIPLGDSASLFFNQLYFRTPDIEKDLIEGLSLEAGISVAFGDDDDNRWEFEIGLIDGDVLRVSVARPLPPAGSEDIPLIHLDLWKIVLDIMRLRAGVSLQELTKDEPDAGKAVQVLGDILIREKPDEESEDSPVDVETPDGKPFEVALTDIGWDRGDISGNIVSPNGASLTVGPFALEIYEMGLVAEHGATYFSISGGIRQDTSPFEGKVWFTRLRGPLAGNPDAPGFKLDGFGAELKVEDVVEVSIHGLFRNELLPDGTRIKEHGLGGKIVIYCGGNKWGLSCDVFWGDRIPPDDPATNYLLFQVVLFGAIPMGPMELQQIEALYADALTPKLKSEDREAGELKYYSWLKKSRPTAIAENRGLSQWKPENGAWAFGAGFGIGFPGVGDNCKLVAFGLGFDSEEAAGLVIVVEFFLFKAKKPLALGIFEYDFKRDAFVLQIKIDIDLQELIDNFPEQLKIKLGGELTFGNKPGIVAFGRIEKQDTWLGATIEIDLSDIFELKIRAAFCFEWVDGEHTSVGFIFSLKILGDIRVVRLEGWGSLLAILRWMASGTGDFVARLLLEAGFALTLFGFLRFGISMSLLADWLAHTPDFFVFRATFRIETPWFLPDVSFTCEVVEGSLEPPARGVLTAPLLEATGSSEQGIAKAEVNRLDGLAGSETPALFSHDDLPNSGAAWQGAATPLPLHGKLEIRFSAMVADRLGIGEIDPDLGVQSTGDDDVKLTTRYHLTGLEVRRRPIAGGAWETVEQITSAADTRKFRWNWDLDTRTGGKTASKKLILNGSTPFSVGYSNPAADAEILTENPAFPCCARREPDVARFDFCDDALGVEPLGVARALFWIERDGFAPIRVRGGAHVVVPPARPGADCPQVGSFALGPAPVLSLTSEEDLYEAALNFTSAGRQLDLVIIARNAEGDMVFNHIDAISGGSAFSTLRVAPGQPFRSLSVYLSPSFDDQEDETEKLLIHHAFVLDWVECVTWDDKAQAEADADRCDRTDSEGDGDVTPFLPQHEYEVAITTQIGVRHSDTEWVEKPVTEHVRFQTSGPPGLNETSEPGTELQPHVVDARAGGRGLLYRSESVHLVLSSDLKVFGPGLPGTDEFGYRLPVTLTVATAFEANTDQQSAKSSFEGREWFLERRASALPRLAIVLRDPVFALATDELKLRLRDLTDAGTGTCTPEEHWKETRPRLGVDPFDARGRPIWQSRSTYRASMRLEGSPLVDRKPFETADLAAFLTTTGSWAVEDGFLRATGEATARFGEADWDYLHLELAADLETGDQISAAALVDSGNDGGGLRFLLSRGAGDTGTLEARPASGGAALGSVALSNLSDTVNLQIDTFADRIRVRAGGEALSIDREDRAGGLCEIGARDAAIRSLVVRGIEMVGFDFKTSAYETFEDHIASAGEPGAIAIGSGAESLATLMPRLGGEIDAAMAPDADDAERERVFNAAAAALAQPLRETTDRLHLDVATNGSDRWLLLESPEPMDFVEEISLSLQRRVVIRTPIDFDLGGRLRDSIATIFDRLPFARPPVIRPPRRFDLPGQGPFRMRAISRTLPTSQLPRLGTFGRRLFERPEPLQLAPGHKRQDTFRLEFANNSLTVTDETTGRITRFKPPKLSAKDRAALSDAIIRFDRFGRIIEWLGRSRVEWHTTPLRVIQNAEKSKVLLLPTSANALPNGDWRMNLHFVRRWFTTSAPVGPDNSYIADAQFEFLIT